MFRLKFVKYNYGPYSFELTRALDTLQNTGLIDVETSLFASSDSKGFQTKQFTYTITKKGDEIILPKMDAMKEVIKKIKILLEKWNNVPRTKVIEHVYSKYM